MNFSVCARSQDEEVLFMSSNHDAVSRSCGPTQKNCLDSRGAVRTMHKWGFVYTGFNCHRCVRPGERLHFPCLVQSSSWSSVPRLFFPFFSFFVHENSARCHPTNCRAVLLRIFLHSSRSDEIIPILNNFRGKK